jgi:hypothetical protein
METTLTKKKLTQEQKDLLKKPLPPEASKQHPTKTYLSSIKAIYVVERFNEVFDIGGWEIENIVVKEDGKWVVVKSTFEAKEYGITIRDIFGGNDNADLGDAYKGACTDALTKIGSYLGVGMDIFKGLSDGKDKPVTAYNHKNIETGGKPLISNASFKKAIERIEAGEAGVKQKVLETYSLHPDQARMLEMIKPKNHVTA